MVVNVKYQHTGIQPWLLGTVLKLHKKQFMFNLDIVAVGYPDYSMLQVWWHAEMGFKPAAGSREFVNTLYLLTSWPKLCSSSSFLT